MNLPRLLPVSMKNDFWIQFIESVQELYEKFKMEAVEQKKDTFNLDALVALKDRERLFDIAAMLGYSIDTTLRPDDYEFIRKEIQSIFFRITKKTTLSSWQYIFNSIPEAGTVSLMYYDGSYLIRPYSEYTLNDKYETGILLYPGTVDIEPNQGFITLDDEPVLNLDSSPPWNLDEELNVIPTSHITLELSPTSLSIVDSEEFIISKPYADYVLNASNRNRKVTDVPHVGVQLNFLMDSSGYYDSANPGSAYSSPTLKIKTSVVGIFSYENVTVATIQVGSGTQILPDSSESSPIYPTGLSNRLYTKDIPPDEFDTQNEGSTQWLRASSHIPANMVNKEIIGIGDGSSSTFSSTLDSTPIKPFSVRIDFTSLSVAYSAADDGKGVLVGDELQGVVDYSTGSITLSTNIPSVTTQTLHAGTDFGGNPLPGITQVNTFLGFTPITPGSFTVAFRTGNGNNSFNVSDNGDGTIGAGDGSDGIAVSPVSTIDYETGQLDLYLTNITDSGFDVISEYEYTKTTVPDSGTPIEAGYVIDDQDHFITEAGLFDDTGVMVAYATFPPVNLGSTAYEYFLNFFIRREDF